MKLVRWRPIAHIESADWTDYSRVRMYCGLDIPTPALEVLTHAESRDVCRKCERAYEREQEEAGRTDAQALLDAGQTAPSGDSAVNP